MLKIDSDIRKNYEVKSNTASYLPIAGIVAMNRCGHGTSWLVHISQRASPESEKTDTPHT